MPFEVTTMVDRRRKFVLAADQDGANVRQLCRQFGISAQTGYRWLGRYRAEGLSGLTDRPCRPRTSPRQTAARTEAAVVTVREAHPSWGGRKLHRWLATHGPAADALVRHMKEFSDEWEYDRLALHAGRQPRLPER
jgi:transposase